MGLNEKVAIKNNSSLEYKQALWKILIAYGSPADLPQKTDRYTNKEFTNVCAAIGSYENWSYYSGRVQGLSVELAEQALAGIREHGINWEDSTVPETGEEREFAGTFASSDMSVPFLCGQLILNNGDSYVFWVQNNGTDFGTLVRLVTDNEVTLDDALEDFEDHITNPVIRKYGHWEYTLEVPAGWKRPNSGYQKGDD